MLGLEFTKTSVELVEITKERFITDHQMTFADMSQHLVSDDVLAHAYDVMSNTHEGEILIWCSNYPVTAVLRNLSVLSSRDQENNFLSVKEVMGKLRKDNIVIVFHAKNFLGTTNFSTLCIDKAVLNRQLRIHMFLKNN